MDSFESSTNLIIFLLKIFGFWQLNAKSTKRHRRLYFAYKVFHVVCTLMLLSTFLYWWDVAQVPKNLENFIHKMSGSVCCCLMLVLYWTSFRFSTGKWEKFIMRLAEFSGPRDRFLRIFQILFLSIIVFPNILISLIYLYNYKFTFYSSYVFIMFQIKCALFLHGSLLTIFLRNSINFVRLTNKNLKKSLQYLNFEERWEVFRKTVDSIDNLLALMGEFCQIFKYKLPIIFLMGFSYTYQIIHMFAVHSKRELELSFIFSK